jgi:hypothetical protein
VPMEEDVPIQRLCGICYGIYTIIKNKIRLSTFAMDEDVKFKLLFCERFLSFDSIVHTC